MAEHNLMDAWRILILTHFNIPGAEKKTKQIYFEDKIFYSREPRAQV